jgi:ElaB/YqjD/DUF883 family membrane-anchored ribosome-binding protein
MGPVTAGPTPEDIQHDMRVTRDHLGDGVQALADRATAFATDAAGAVGDACRGSRDAVHAARAAIGRGVAGVPALVGRAMDVRRHVRRHPWVAVGVAVGLGFACDRLLTRR